MSDTENKTVPAKVLRDFTDAGSERNFTAGSTVDLTAGELANFRAAGLVEEVLDLSPETVLDLGNA